MPAPRADLDVPGGVLAEVYGILLRAAERTEQSKQVKEPLAGGSGKESSDGMTSETWLDSSTADIAAIRARVLTFFGPHARRVSPAGT